MNQKAQGIDGRIYVQVSGMLSIDLTLTGYK